MKYRCFCHRDNYLDLTREETRMMLRSPKAWEVPDVIEYYNIPRDNLRMFLKNRGVTMSPTDRNAMSAWDERKAKEKVSGGSITSKSSKFSLTVADWPLAIVCALENVSYENINGKRSYDLEEYRRAAEVLQERIDNYLDDRDKPKKNELQLTKSDLIAMRYYRGVNRMEMAKRMIQNKRDIVAMENTSPVTKEIADAYKKTLNIKDSHIYQLRKIMTGKLSRVEDDRMIPGKIKVAVYTRDKGCCRECGKKEKLHYHHIEHYSKGGQNTLENLKLLCAGCHAEVHKGDKSYYLLKKMAED